MSGLDKWLDNARDAHGDAVAVCIPADSHPVSFDAIVDTGWRSADEASIGGVFYVAFLVVFGSITGALRRLKNRDKPVGQRGGNNKVALLFQGDSVLIHRRHAFSGNIGRLLESHSTATAVLREEQIVEIGGTKWHLDREHHLELDSLLNSAGIALGE